LAAKQEELKKAKIQNKELEAMVQEKDIEI